MKKFHKRRIHKRREHVQWRNFSPEKETIIARSISRDYWITSNRAKFPRRMSSSNHLLWMNFSPEKALRKDRSIFDAKNWSCHRRKLSTYHVCRSPSFISVSFDAFHLLQAGGLENRFGLYADCLWYVIVTATTTGYGFILFLFSFTFFFSFFLSLFCSFVSYADCLSNVIVAATNSFLSFLFFFFFLSLFQFSFTAVDCTLITCSISLS